MLTRRLAILVCGVALWPALSAEAHFLWLLHDTNGNQVKVYFGESASPDDPELLDRVTKAEAWALGGRRGSEPQPLKLEKKGDALVADLPAELAQSPVALRHTYGTLTRGNETFLLKYYAKTYPLGLPGTWRAIDNEELLPLEIGPKAQGDHVALRVLWQGKILPGAIVTVAGPGIDKQLEGPADEQGVFHCTLTEAGLYSIRAKHTEEAAGEHEGKAYGSVRHYSTLSLMFLPARLQSGEHSLPALAKGVTSFGGAVAGDWLYVYGGHYGAAHHYSQDDQSGDFARINLREPGEWQSLPGGPKLTGLALVAHNGLLYRVGGFAAKNADGEQEILQSQSDFARFDPAANSWQPLPSLPEGRSSHDAAVVGDTLYVVGGWKMQGGETTVWHDAALAMDLSAETLAWKTIPQPPFHRRALALAAWNDRLYCLGGMQETGGPTTAVAVFDPAAGAWSEGPALLGSGMDGFGCSAFACGGALFATTMSGSVQQLSGDGSRWEFAAQLRHPRFFHRMLSWHDDRLIIVGGASMTTGKVTALELLPVPVAQASK